MTDAEDAILQFLEANRESQFSRREIARKAVHRRIFEENNHWADVPLAALVASGKVELTDGGLYQLPERALF